MILLKEWLPDAPVERIIVHWTAGTYTPSPKDLEHYHFLVDGDLMVHRGKYSVANVAPEHVKVGGEYAAHVKSFNTGSIGIAACSMANASISGNGNLFYGKFPLKYKQWEMLAKIAAELVNRYHIPIQPVAGRERWHKRGVAQHGEVESIWGVRQDRKWDILRFPWDVAITLNQAANLFRMEVKENL